MPEGQIIRFKIGEAFPADDQLERWMTVCAMALNDLLLVNRWLIPMLQEKVPAEPYETFHLGRLAAAHLFETATFLGKSEKRHHEVDGEVAALVLIIPKGFRDDALRAIEEADADGERASVIELGLPSN